MPPPRHVGPVIAVRATEAALHRLRPLRRRSHAPECSHRHRVTANVDSDHSHAQYQLRRPRCEEQRDGAAITVPHQVHLLETTIREQHPEILGVLVKHPGRELTVMRGLAKTPAVVRNCLPAIRRCGKEGVPRPRRADPVMEPHGGGLAARVFFDVHCLCAEVYEAHCGYEIATAMPPKVAIAAEKAAVDRVRCKPTPTSTIVTVPVTVLNPTTVTACSSVV
jgi:hypothetical protein